MSKSFPSFTLEYRVSETVQRVRGAEFNVAVVGNPEHPLYEEYKEKENDVDVDRIKQYDIYRMMNKGVIHCSDLRELYEAFPIHIEVNGQVLLPDENDTIYVSDLVDDWKLEQVGEANIETNEEDVTGYYGPF